jgi:hypothetical protein
MPPERRLSIRKAPDHLAYISLPSNNGGIVVDVSEGGLCFHAIAPVEADGPIHFRFAIDSADRVPAVGELAWKDKTGKTGGLRFTELPEEVRERIRTWTKPSEARVLDIPAAKQAIESEVAANSEGNLAPVAAIPAAEPAIDAEAAPSSDAELASVATAGNPLLYNLKPPVYSAPFNKLSMFPLEPDFKAGATAAVVPQFVHMLDEVAEQIRVLSAEWKPGSHDDPFADPAFETEAAPGSGTELATVVDVPKAEPAASGKAELAPLVDMPVAEPTIKAEAAPSSKVDLAPVVADRNPLLYNLKPSIYSGPSNAFSMFPLGPESETGTSPVVVPQSVGIKHPIAAVGLTIVLAFLVSTGIFAYLCTSRAGDLLFSWGEKMWGGAYSQSIPGDAAPPVNRLPDSAKTPQQ